MKILHLAVLAVFVALTVGGCSTGPAIVNEWRNPAYEAMYFKRVMVAGPAGQASVRRNVEDEFTARLRAAGVESMPSYQYLAGDEKVDEAALKQAAQKAGADALLFTQTMRVEPRTQAPTYAPWTWFGIFGSHVGVSWSGTPGASAPYRYNEYTMDTTLYDLAKNEIVWSGTIKTTEAENARTAIRSYVDTVMKTLDEKNHVRGRK
jgi:hypothetical protein